MALRIPSRAFLYLRTIPRVHPRNTLNIYRSVIDIQRRALQTSRKPTQPPVEVSKIKPNILSKFIKQHPILFTAIIGNTTLPLLLAAFTPLGLSWLGFGANIDPEHGYSGMHQLNLLLELARIRCNTFSFHDFRSSNLIIAESGGVFAILQSAGTGGSGLATVRIWVWSISSILFWNATGPVLIKTLRRDKKKRNVMGGMLVAVLQYQISLLVPRKTFYFLYLDDLPLWHVLFLAITLIHDRLSIQLLSFAFLIYYLPNTKLLLLSSPSYSPSSPLCFSHHLTNP
ncbi:uncharacterized protein BDR25DRAFT_396023 [Lindgomyces ingoldianus]|uniref:Uncharacterized protein n=1 Tax=Lindgomyces ingoldianus TaxID=673940 RepID=A0ACB6QII2_9PLEO|nr:uncharacterized protein BDR25DRAFT_396023 [Lindgomyces ingoldianus]KAF2465922.1 hypothetical protein BDR25DRAFT_396023 [Lindgomyces ingoldianus]